MRRWIGKVVFLTFSLSLAMPVPATAQDTQGKLGMGLSFLGDDGGVGVTVDYSKPFHSLANNRSFGWVADFSFHGNDVGDSGIEVDLKSFTFQGGVRLTGPFGANERLTWHAQGLLGVMHVTAGADSLLEDICDDLDIDCDESDTGVIFSPGAGLDYWFSPRTSIRAQIDFPIGEGGATTRAWFGIARRMGE
jgi:YD repeat-containing protein